MTKEPPRFNASNDFLCVSVFVRACVCVQVGLGFLSSSHLASWRRARRAMLFFFFLLPLSRMVHWSWVNIIANPFFVGNGIHVLQVREHIQSNAWAARQGVWMQHNCDDGASVDEHSYLPHTRLWCGVVGLWTNRPEEGRAARRGCACRGRRGEG